MGLCPCNNRRRPSINLDAGYVIYQSTETIGLHGKKLICVICVILSLFLISLINLTCLIWVMRKLEWSIFDKNGSRVFRIDKINEQVEFYKQVLSKEPIYTTQINHKDRMNILANQQIDMYGDQNSIIFDDNQILFNIDKFSFNNQTSIDFTNLQLFKFDSRKNTRIHLDQFNSQHIHHKHLNLTANNHLTISNMNQAFFFSQYLALEANRHHRQSILRFNNYPRKKKTWNYDQKFSSGNIHFKSDSVYFDLPRFPLLGHNYRSDSGISRLCICNTTYLFLRTFAHQSCPYC